MSPGYLAERSDAINLAIVILGLLFAGCGLTEPKEGRIVGTVTVTIDGQSVNPAYGARTVVDAGGDYRDFPNRHGYLLGPLPPGDYVVSLACQRPFENAPYYRLLASERVYVSAGETVELHFAEDLGGIC